jgi:hypothetical protein
MPHQMRSNGQPDSADDAAPAERDDVEARAAALQAQMAARRANQIDHGPPSSDNGAPDEPAVPADEPPEPANRPPTRRLAPPPWQLHTTIGSREFAERFESEGARPPSHHPERPHPDIEAVADEPVPAEPPPPQANWQQAPPLPPPPPLGWMPPPPGWLPPPPPGWLPPPPPAREHIAVDANPDFGTLARRGALHGARRVA